MCEGDINGHMGRSIDAFYGVHEGYGVGQRTLEGRMLLDSLFSWVHPLRVTTTSSFQEEETKC